MLPSNSVSGALIPGMTSPTTLIIFPVWISVSGGFAQHVHLSREHCRAPVQRSPALWNGLGRQSVRPQRPRSAEQESGGLATKRHPHQCVPCLTVLMRGHAAVEERRHRDYEVRRGQASGTFAFLDIIPAKFLCLPLPWVQNSSFTKGIP